jgi:hypothetical protein
LPSERWHNATTRIKSSRRSKPIPAIHEDRYAAGGEPASLARADLNGDGKLDLATAHNHPVDGVGVLLARPGFCTVQDVRVVTVEDAKRMLARANCRLGKIRRAYSNRVEKGLVLSQKPKPGTVLPKFGKVDLRVSRGPRS